MGLFFVKNIQNRFKKALTGQENAEPVEKQFLQEIRQALSKLAIFKIKQMTKINQF